MDKSYVCCMDLYARSLCLKCQHVRRIENKRGSVFLMCGKSKEDERFAKYPPQPLGECVGFVEVRNE